MIRWVKINAMTVFFLLALLAFAFPEETLTITTYYPSPYGSYNELTVANREAIGDVNVDGGVDSSDLAVDSSGPLPGSLTVAGSVGIGTTTPDAKLAVIGEGSSVARIGSADCGGNYVGIGLNGAMSGCANYSLLGGDNSTVINRPIGGSIYFRMNNSNQMVLNSSGNVGIGTTAPNGKLSIAGAGGSVTTDGIEWYSGPGNATGYAGWAGRAYIGTPTGGWATAPFIFAVPNTSGDEIQAMTLLNGNVGIGRIDPNEALAIYRAGGVQTAIDFWQAGQGAVKMGFPASASTFYITNTYYGDALGTASRSISLTNAGNVGIGKADPNYNLDVAGDVNGQRLCINGVCRDSWQATQSIMQFGKVTIPSNRGRSANAYVTYPKGPFPPGAVPIITIGIEGVGVSNGEWGFQDVTNVGFRINNSMEYGTTTFNWIAVWSES